MNTLIFILFCLATILAAEDCHQCLLNGKHFCAAVNQCDFSLCPNPITKQLNCPALPDPNYAYNDTFIRENIVITTAAAFGSHPQKCFDNQLPTMKLLKVTSVNCSQFGPETNCFGYTAYDTIKKVIVIAFRGTDGDAQFGQEFYSFIRGKKAFFNAGHIYEYFYDAFLFMWTGGMQADLRNLKYQYPDYELWVNGHSLGGALASVAASYIVQIGLYKPENIKLVTMGQPRTGDYEYAVWHDITFPYSYRIVHHKDIVPHVPPQYGADELFHHRTEIWYNNNMAVGDPYHVCQEADGLYCSNTQLDPIWSDHMSYFDMPIVDWGGAGCPKN